MDNIEVNINEVAFNQCCFKSIKATICLWIVELHEENNECLFQLIDKTLREAKFKIKDNLNGLVIIKVDGKILEIEIEYGLYFLNNKVQK